MKLAISNIAWNQEDDQVMYGKLKEMGFSGLEIAPTRIFPENPYEKIEEATKYGVWLKENYGLSIPSMQSIWYGRSENIFADEEQTQILLQYTKKAIDFAAAIGCKNLVFGCPKNRSYEEGQDLDVVIPFFRELGEYALQKGIILAMEANPPIYHTNYINTTQSAFDLVEQVNSNGFMVNLDIGTMIQNEEEVEILKGKIDKINHVHISEPFLETIEKRKIHVELQKILAEEEYHGMISIEMKNQGNIEMVLPIMAYVKETFR